MPGPLFLHLFDLPAFTHSKTAASPHPMRKARSLIEPEALPNRELLVPVSGNVSDRIKQLNENTFHHYGVVGPDTFGYCVGSQVKFTDISIHNNADRNDRTYCETIAELEVTKNCLNGAGMLHGAVVTYLIDNCASTPLLVLGLHTKVNGVGVTSQMNVLFHSPAPLGTVIQIISTSITLGSRVMSSRCEIIDKRSGRIIASALLNKMQPAETSKL